MSLRFTVSDDSGHATVAARLSRKGRLVGRLRARSILADPKKIASFSWRVPRTLRGRVVFCVTARDGAGHSGSSCTTLRIR